ncbi:hypothetical protein ACEZCY_21010 [Streptacidiphilus sp. N1-12]|uniref:Uncharacterized protein n=2 Tax=Streptacidiphilus alkalitolerans TaxID=3342712 RepID=A0ABV6X1Z2_9ACTN
MATNNTATFQVNKRLLAAGAVLTGSGALLALVGTAIAGTALATAGRGWVQNLETPPSELATRALRQARAASQAASQAGADAWRSQAQ